MSRRRLVKPVRFVYTPRIVGDPAGTRSDAPRDSVAAGAHSRARELQDREVGLVRRAYVVLIAAAVAAALIAGCGTTPTTGLARGQRVFQTCVPCHGEHGSGNLELRAPAIAGLPRWYVETELHKFMNDIRGAHPDDNEGARMRPMARTLYHPGDLEAVAQYVSSMPSTYMPPMYPMADTAAGRTIYQGICTTCHQPDGHGNQTLGAPPIVNQADWYLIAQVRKFQGGLRGAHPLDTLGQQMRAMSLTMPDSVAMHNVIAFVKTLPH